MSESQHRRMASLTMIARMLTIGSLLPVVLLILFAPVTPITVSAVLTSPDVSQALRSRRQVSELFVTLSGTLHLSTFAVSIRGGEG